MGIETARNVCWVRGRWVVSPISASCGVRQSLQFRLADSDPQNLFGSRYQSITYSVYIYVPPTAHTRDTSSPKALQRAHQLKCPASTIPPIQHQYALHIARSHPWWHMSCIRSSVDMHGVDLNRQHQFGDSSTPNPQGEGVLAAPNKKRPTKSTIDAPF